MVVSDNKTNVLNQLLRGKIMLPPILLQKKKKKTKVVGYFFPQKIFPLYFEGRDFVEREKRGGKTILSLKNWSGIRYVHFLSDSIL